MCNTHRGVTNIDWPAGMYCPTETFDLVTMIFCGYSILPDDQRKSLLEIMRSSLKEDGCIFLDVCTEKLYEKIVEGTSLRYIEKDGFWSPFPHFEFTSAFKYEENLVSLEKYTIVEEARTFEIYNWFKYFTLEELSREFEAAGLKLPTSIPISAACQAREKRRLWL